MERELIRRYLLDRQEYQQARSFVPREMELDLAFLEETGKIAAIIGPRRAGKSMYLLQIAHELGLPARHCVWVDFSEYLWADFRDDDWTLLYEVALELAGGVRPVFFLDELQELGSFASGLRYLQNQGVRIFITGSNSRFFVRDLTASLRGKVLSYQLYTLSFSEFLCFKNERFPEQLSSTQAARRNNLLVEFLTWGGFPEVVLAEREDLKRHLIDSYVDTMLLRDVMDRHGIKNLPVLERLFAKVLASLTKEFSVHRWFHDLKSQGFRLSKDTLYEYLGFLEESLFVCTLENAANPAAARKVFLVDNGLYQKVMDRPDYGKLWENACFLQLLRDGQSVRYWRDADGELDFVTDTALIQATWELTEVNRTRELQPLRTIAPRLPGRTPFLWEFPELQPRLVPV